jgi:hypothetical protein
VTSQLSEINEQTNDISNEAIFYENAESAKKIIFEVELKNRFLGGGGGGRGGSDCVFQVYLATSFAFSIIISDILLAFKLKEISDIRFSLLSVSHPSA